MKKNFKFVQEFKKLDHSIPFIVAGFVGVFLLLINLLYITGCMILYIRMAGQNCIPDGGFWTYLDISLLWKTCGIFILAAYVVVYVAMILLMETTTNSIIQVTKPITNKLPSINLDYTLPEPSKFWKIVGNIFFWIYVICMVLLVLGIIVFTIYALFFDDPCQYLN